MTAKNIDTAVRRFPTSPRGPLSHNGRGGRGGIRHSPFSRRFFVGEGGRGDEVRLRNWQRLLLIVFSTLIMLIPLPLFAQSASPLEVPNLVTRMLSANPTLQAERSRVSGMGYMANSSAFPMGPQAIFQTDKMGTLDIGIGLTIPSVPSALAKSDRLWSERERMRLETGTMTLKMAVMVAMGAWMITEQEARAKVLAETEAEWAHLDSALAGSYIAGKTMYMDRERAGLAAASAKADREVLAVEIAKSRGELNTLLAWPYDTTLTLGLSMEDSLPSPETAEGYLAASLVRPEIMATRFRRLAAVASLSEAKGMYFPEIMLEYHRVRPAMTETFDDWMFMAKLSLPIFGFWREGRMVSSAKAEIRAADADSETASREITREQHSILNEYRASWTRVHSLEQDLIPRAQSTWRAVLGAYTSGMASFEALSDAQRMLLMYQEERIMKRGQAQQVLADIVICCGLLPGLGKVVTQEASPDTSTWR